MPGTGRKMQMGQTIFHLGTPIGNFEIPFKTSCFDWKLIFLVWQTKIALPLTVQTKFLVTYLTKWLTGTPSKFVQYPKPTDSSG